MRCLALFAAALLSSAAWVHADGLVYRLPEDGTAVRFGMTIKANRKGVEKEITGELIQRSVGKVEENGVPCRWIEFKMTFEENGMPRTMLAKALIPEKALKAGENPGAHMLRGWSQRMADEPKELKDLNSTNAGPVTTFLSGPPTDAKKLPKETIDSKLGPLECEGVVGMANLTQGQEKVEVKMENRLHDKAPFGVVRCRMEFQVERDGQPREQGVITLTLLEVTKDAKSDLPEKK